MNFHNVFYLFVIGLFFSFSRIAKEADEFAEIQLNDLKVIATLGVGGFGRVELVSVYIKSGGV